MVKSPVLYTAGLLRQRGKRVETGDWVYLDAVAGQQLFYPPNVIGWDETRWLNTSTFQARWMIARRALQNIALEPGPHHGRERPPADPEQARRLGARLVGNRSSLDRRPATRSSTTPRTTMAAAIADPDRQKTFPIMAYNALRHLAACSPEMQTA